MDRRIRISAIIVTIGLIISLVSLLIRHPLAFVLFLGVGALLMVIGAIYYLVALIRHTESAPPATPAPPTP